ncbi:MAG: hypothetical protein KAG20_00490 [Cocleimonas sp.]|nr:hypothetical protein [Cocleimonas sp.]
MTTKHKLSPKNYQNNGVNQQQDQDSLELVRNILFGEQVKQTEQRGVELEKLLEISISLLRDETDKKIASLSQQLSALTHLLADETKLRTDAQYKVENSFKHVSEKLSQLETILQKEQVQRQESIVNEANKTAQHVKRLNDELTLKFDQVVAQLRDEKVSRKAISNLLGGVAKQLLDNNERS